MKLGVLGLVVVLAVGCGTDYGEAPEGASEAVRVAWEAMGTYGAPPKIRWRTGSELNCGTNNGGWKYGGICVAGLTYHGGYMELSWYEGVDWDKIALAHEFEHVIRYRIGGSQAHVPEFYVRPAFGEAALRAAAAAGQIPPNCRHAP